MDMNHKALDQIALTLTKHFDSLYYVDIRDCHSKSRSGNVYQQERSEIHVC